MPYPQAIQAVAPYKALLDREDVDAVYIPLPTALRHQWVIRAAEKGKHILAEKPAALDASQVREMLSVLRAAQCAVHGWRHVHARRVGCRCCDNCWMTPRTSASYAAWLVSFRFVVTKSFALAIFESTVAWNRTDVCGSFGLVLHSYILVDHEWQVARLSPRSRMLSSLHGDGSPRGSAG